MNYVTFSLGSATIHVVEDTLAHLKLLQSDILYKLSGFYYGSKKPDAIINCSYFTSSYVIGRNQGDLKQDTSSYTDKEWLGFALKEDGTYATGKLEWWDVTNSVCGFTPSVICIENGQQVQLCSPELAVNYARKMGLATAVTFFGILKDKKTALLITGTKGVTGYQVMELLLKHYSFDFLCELDGGGSSELIYRGSIKQGSTDSTGERKMFNGLAFVNTEPQEATLCFRDYKGNDLISGITQPQKTGTHIHLKGANDFNGRSGSDRVDLLAPYDCVVKAIGTGDNTVFFESLAPVKTPSGVFESWFMCTHILDADFNALGLKVGKVFYKGEPCYTEGAKGIGSGYHIHMEQGKGRYNGSGSPYYKGAETFSVGSKTYAQYYPCQNGEELPLADAFYIADVEVCNTADGNNLYKHYPNAVKLGAVVEEEKEEVKEVTLEEAIKDLEDEFNAKLEALALENKELKEKLEAKTKLLEIAENGAVELRNKLEKIKELCSE